MSRFTRRQDPVKTEEDRLKMKEKLDKVCSCMYIGPGIVFSLSRMSYVNKGLNDIRLVCNAATPCVLNSVLWAYFFGLPAVQHILCSLLPGYYQCNIDVGEMFMNFPLHHRSRLSAGVDITHVRG